MCEPLLFVLSATTGLSHPLDTSWSLLSVLVVTIDLSHPLDYRPLTSTYLVKAYIGAGNAVYFTLGTSSYIFFFFTNEDIKF